jgi:hypothetical protein
VTYEAVETFSAPGRTLRAGETVEDDDPLVESHGDMLRKVDKGRRVHTQDDAVEEATAEPGAKRNTKRS